ncbi:MAG: cobalamin biosynthesis protein CobN [Deltaproteobacteria bacterium]|nr:cobalamin biosynthesis protein CobN [Deltaproteobacteria bacterium]HCH61166.1 cobalamin biosynthesis protein CobN [Deltaproteobacteria bacterium]
MQSACHTSILRLALTALLVLLSASDAFAARIVGVVSNRSAAETASGAHTFLDRNASHTVILRTTDQIAALTDDRIGALWAGADAVVLLGVHGEQVPRLKQVLAEYPPPAEATLLALSSDPSMTPIARIDGQATFEGVSDETFHALTHALAAAEDRGTARRRLALAHPGQAAWLEASAYRDARGSENVAGLLAWVAARHSRGVAVPAPIDQSPIRYMIDGELRAADTLALPADRGVVALLDYDSGDRPADRAVHESMCAALASHTLSCLSVLARWGEASVTAMEGLDAVLGEAPLSAVVVLQDFVVGGGEGRQAATAAFARLDVPVISAIRLSDRDQADWALSTDGIPWEKVHNVVAMPELQGQGQPHVIAVDGPARVDARTGLRLVGPEPIPTEVERLAARLARWRILQIRPNADKRVAIIYYNHPPGRHNIGADNLDVPGTLVELLRLLHTAGYQTGPVPDDAEALLERLQATGVNLGQDAGALKNQHTSGVVLENSDYQSWFQTLSEPVRQSVEGGPLTRLRNTADQALQAGRIELARDRIAAAMGDTHHLLEGVDHPSRARGLDLAHQLEVAYERVLAGDADQWGEIDALTEALGRTGIEGLTGWGAAPGSVMTWQDDLLIPGMALGNVWMGPQPPRGWEVNEELLHANLTFPPHHQYLAWYHYVRDIWKADVVIHVGRHSTAEFLPGKRNGLSGDDYPQLVLGDLPNAYIYIVDGVGEGIQAKRRGNAIIIDHLTPALSTTPLYDDLLELRQLVESYEAAESGSNSPAQLRAIEQMRQLISTLNLEAELAASMAGELEVRGITFAEVDDDLLVHEVGHYLTHLQEEFMPLGLHVFGRAWSAEQVETMLSSMFGGDPIPDAVRDALVESPGLEGTALLAALDGRFIAPGKGNDPVRTEAVLPTGRNFHALGGEQTPTRIAWDLGRTLAADAVAGESPSDEAEAVILWASDTVRDEGAMIAFGLALLGVEPVWNSRGILKGIAPVPGVLPEGGRRDVTFVTSGLFRDLYPNQLVWLDRAWLLALDASSESIRSQHPGLAPALDATLSRLDATWRAPGSESLARNQVAAHWVRDTRAQVEAGVAAVEAGRSASLRIFGNAPGGYGAGLNRLAERSGAWDTRMELADAWILRMGHAYGAGIDGQPAHGAFSTRLTHTGRTYLGRASNLYGLLDNNDAFDYLGGLSLAVEQARGAAPHSRVISHADPSAPRMAPLDTELLTELRGRELNPAWISPLMDHGYAGARTMGTGFMENLWGWQVTNPEIVQPWVWDDVKRVYIDDGHGLGLDAFLSEGHNVHVRINMLAILLTAADKGFYEPSEADLAQIAREFAELVIAHGLPGSGHTRPDHPIMGLVRGQLDATRMADFQAVLDAARLEGPAADVDPATVSEVEIAENTPVLPWAGWAVGLGALSLVGLGVLRGTGRT